MKKLVCSYVTTRQTHEIWWIQDSFGKFIYIYINKIYLKGQFYLKSIWTEEKVSQTIVTSSKNFFSYLENFSILRKCQVGGDLFKCDVSGSFSK